MACGMMCLYMHIFHRRRCHCRWFCITFFTKPNGIFYSSLWLWGHSMLWLIHIILSLSSLLVNLFICPRTKPANMLRGQIYNQFGTHSLIYFIHIIFFGLSFALLSFIAFVSMYITLYVCIYMCIVSIKVGLSITIYKYDFCAAVECRWNG